jgi:hypothetical protein
VSWIRNLSLRGKLFGSFSVVVVLCALVGVVGWRSLADNAERLDGIYGDQFGGEVLQTKLAHIIGELQINAGALLTTPDVTPLIWR